ncbi:MAG: hypothetical protein KC478_08105, partial [Bacteriovoracaceae bacterium]|nr:hypothetical protein [Bacteriovoracaceae bacterium]
GLVLNNVPVSLSFCSSDYFIKGRPNTCAPHAVTIVGIKESCNAQSCKILFKVQNSYGQEWQDRNNDGWVEAMPLIKRARAYRTAGYMTWVTNDNKKLPNKKLARTTLDQLTPNADRFPGNIDINRGPIFKCDTYYGDWKPNRGCSFVKYRR